MTYDQAVRFHANFSPSQNRYRGTTKPTPCRKTSGEPIRGYGGGCVFSRISRRRCVTRYSKNTAKPSKVRATSAITAIATHTVCPPYGFRSELKRHSR